MPHGQHAVSRLESRYPTVVEAMPLGRMNKESYPVGCKIRFDFPKRKAHLPVEHPHLFHHYRKIEHDAVTLWWYDGGQPDPTARGGHDLSNKPPAEVTADIVALRGNVPDSGCLLIGDGGKVFSPDDYGTFLREAEGNQNSSTTPSTRRWRNIRSASRATITAIQAEIMFFHAQEWLVAVKEDKPEFATRVFTLLRASRSCCSAAYHRARVRRLSGIKQAEIVLLPMHRTLANRFVRKTSRRSATRAF